MKVGLNSVTQQDTKSILRSMREALTVLKGKTILIAGAGGFLPSYLVHSMMQLNEMHPGFGVKVIALVRSKQNAMQRLAAWTSSPGFTLIEKDVCEEFTPDGPIDYIIHAASHASPKYFGLDPVGIQAANVTGTFNLLKLAREKKVESFLFFSSAEVYGALPPEQMPVTEDCYGFIDPLDLRSCYGQSKRMGENLCVAWWNQYGVPARIVRPFHTYGPGMALDDGRVFADIVADVVLKRDIKLHTPGLAQRAFCYVADATMGFLTVLLSGKNAQAYNVGNPAEEYSIADLARMVATLRADQKVNVLIDSPNSTSGYLPSQISRITPDISRIKALGWSPSTTAPEGFARTIASYLEA